MLSRTHCAQGFLWDMGAGGGGGGGHVGLLEFVLSIVCFPIHLDNYGCCMLRLWNMESGTILHVRPLACLLDNSTAW